MRGLRIAAWGVAGAVVAFLVLGVAGVARAMDWLPPGVRVFVALVVLAPVLVGLVIVNRQPRNRIAWILLLGPFVLTLTLPAGVLLGEGWTLQLDRATWPLLYAWPMAIAFVFPTGALLTPRWRWAAGFAAFSFVGFMTIAMLDPEPFWGDDASVANPLADNAAGEWILDTGLWIPFWIAILASLFAAAAAMIVRLRRASGVERLQMLWLAWSATLIPVVLLLCAASSWAFGDSFLDWLLFPLIMLMQVAVAASVGVAVLRYRLYAIELIVSRTLVYASLTIILLSTYVIVTVGLGVVVGGSSALVTAAATLAAATAFLPLRRQVQELVDRRFRRARYQGVHLVRAFEDEVRDGGRAPEEIGGVLAEALDDPLAELFFWLPETEAHADSSGTVVRELPGDDRPRREILRDDARTATLVHDPSLLERRDLLDGVLGAATLSIEMARLRVELRLQLAEVQASRARIVEAGYEERRRLERDLHDGAQQRLVSLGVQLRRMQLTLPREARILSPALDRIVAEVGAAIADLRQIAAGVRPARLDDGLAAALQDLARTSPVPVHVEVLHERLPASVEAAAYFVACEALTNAVKHGSPSQVAVQAVRVNGALHVRISDDGVGGAIVRRGSGLAGLRDRVAAHGGTFELRSRHGEGTSIEAALPCGS